MNFKTDCYLISKINLDIDRDFYSLTRSYDLDDLIAQIRDIFPPGRKAWIRRSAQGNTHIKIESDREFSLFESFLIRAALRDDPNRITHDLSRLYHFSDVGLIGRLFDEKMIKGNRCTAGDWEVLEIANDKHRRRNQERT